MKSLLMECFVFPSIFLLLGAIAILLVGNADFVEQVREQVVYCENVKLKIWPDYKGSYESECTAEKLKQYEIYLR